MPLSGLAYQGIGNFVGGGHELNILINILFFN